MNWRLLGLVTVLVLTGCASKAQRLGFSQQQWKTMSDAKRQQLWQGHQTITKKRQEQLSKPLTVYAGPELNIYMLRGSAMMPPFEKRYPFHTTNFRIQPGQCREVNLKSVDTDNQVDMRLCYNGLKLSLDPSRYLLEQQNGTAFIEYNPIWKRGFTYSNINTEGYVRLKNASISVKAIPKASK